MVRGRLDLWAALGSRAHNHLAIAVLAPRNLISRLGDLPSDAKAARALSSDHWYCDSDRTGVRDRLHLVLVRRGKGSMLGPHRRRDLWPLPMS